MHIYIPDWAWLVILPLIFFVIPRAYDESIERAVQPYETREAHNLRYCEYLKERCQALEAENTLLKKQLGINE